ncbi:MAG: peroxiredoxin family protein [Syntrophaceae bacterium]
MKKLLARAAVIAVSLACVAAGTSAQESKGGSYTKIPTVKGIENLKVGAPAPDFTVMDVDDKEFRLQGCCGNDAVLLFFWSFFCGPCRDEMPLINEMTRSFSGKGLQVIGVNLDGVEMKKAIQKFIATEKIAFRIVFDELDGDAFRIADPYGVAGTPALFVIDKKGIVSYVAVGAVTAPTLRTEIEKATK